jgi:hypothetical protein
VLGHLLSLEKSIKIHDLIDNKTGTRMKRIEMKRIGMPEGKMERPIAPRRVKIMKLLLVLQGSL